ATSVGMTMARPPSASTSRRAPSSPSHPRASRATLSPWRAKARAAARPTPADAPVITTTRGRSNRGIGRSVSRDVIASLPHLHQPDLLGVAERGFGTPAILVVVAGGMVHHPRQRRGGKGSRQLHPPHL